ncbi:hypothetical protein [Limnobacter sp.]|uniref:hypothetical protein n=1 Tax=Limnobacter sp. TaxID=2003368 RepID=UPI0025B7FB4C|nr:hypothetical protein [Limnobacter sp.]
MFSSTEYMAQVLVREWIKLYQKSPRITVVATVLGLVIGGFSIYFAEQSARETREAKRLQNLSYAKQVQALDETRTSLQSLLEFVDSERRNLQLSQQALQSLKTERERLQPLVESDRKTIDALFAAQEARNQAAQSTERWIGFGLGVLSSLIASIVWAAIAYATRRQKP